VPYDSPPFPPESDGSPGQQANARMPRKLTVTRVAAVRTRELTGRALRGISAASRADGAGESGLSGLIWTNATQMAGDAMIAVCLAGTIFFSAATSQQRTNVALYLLITMAPFAVVAPVLGPLLDRLHHGRRFALAGTMLGRAFLAYVMAANFDNIGLYPAAFGTLVLSKAYGVLKGACVPRVLPDRMTLVAANARLSLFGLGASLVGGGLLGGFIRLTGSYPWALRITAVVFVWGAVRSLRLPSHVDSSEGEVAATVIREVTGRRLFGGDRRTLGGQVVTALRAASALRGMSGFLTLFMAFLIQQDEHGWTALLSLGAVAGGVAAGSVAGTALGARLRLARPDVIVLVCVGSTAAVCVLAALSYSIQTAVLLGLVAGLTNSLGKLCLDAIIQRDVVESMRASAFGHSETLLQLAWVFGGGLGIALPSNGRIGFAVAAALLVAAFVLALVGRRRIPARAGAAAGASGAAGGAAGNLGSTDPHPAG
jgi:Major Facilitator Superfamily